MTFCHFYAICCARLYQLETDQNLQQQYLQQLKHNLTKLQEWADIAANNFYSYYTLIVAELAVIEGNQETAGNYYFKTIEHARQHNYILLQAYANESLGNYYLRQNYRFAKGYLEEACYLYSQCGAKLKAKTIWKKISDSFSELSFAPEQSNPTNRQDINYSRENIALDLQTILKASQALSSEIMLEELLRKLMKIVLANAGAERGYLVLENNHQWQIVATAECEQVDISLENPIIALDHNHSLSILPQTILNYVIHTHKSLVLNHAATETNFNRDAYIQKLKPKSVLCLPLLNQGKLVGILYLENNLTKAAFTPAHLEILTFLSTQAAISIENATLYNTLELKVQERTQELSQTLNKLQQTQTQLIQSEKMSAIGQMVAGVAHEINNPVNFIHGNIAHVYSYAEDLSNIIKAYQQSYPNPPEKIQELLTEIDINFLLEDLYKITQSMKSGTQRIGNIVVSLRNFARHDEADFKYADINQAIDSTLMLLTHRLPNIKLNKQYQSLPEIECYASQINQVFFNLLVNAIDAIEAKFNTNNLNTTNQQIPTISIYTQAFANKIKIAIADNGIGISKEIRHRLFDPFFTTKPIGQGTGLGLSTSYEIVVNKHGGKLWCESTVGEGSKFVIEIPVLNSPSQF